MEIHIHRDFAAIRIILAFLPLYLGFYISFTRVTDYWHHYEDVTFGILIGVAVAIVAENIYFDQIYGNLLWSDTNHQDDSDRDTNDTGVPLQAISNNEKLSNE